MVFDDFFEGAAWWAGPPKGTGDVLGVITEDEQLILRYATAPPPPAGALLRLYPPRYLNALLALWKDPQWATPADNARLEVARIRPRSGAAPLATRLSVVARPSGAATAAALKIVRQKGKRRYVPREQSRAGIVETRRRAGARCIPRAGNAGRARRRPEPRARVGTGAQSRRRTGRRRLDRVIDFVKRG